MTTEKRVDLTYEPIMLHDKYCGVLRGLWKMVGDKMGGPFVSHAFLDTKTQRVIVAEGLVYARKQPSGIIYVRSKLHFIQRAWIPSPADS